MAEKRSISAKAIFADIKAGATDAQIIAKYHLSANTLAAVKEKFIAAGFSFQEKVQHGSAAIDGGLPSEKSVNESREYVRTEMLLAAAKSGDLHAVQRALDTGIDINARDSEGNTAFIVATRSGHKKMADFLRTKGASIRPKHDTPDVASTLAPIGNHSQAMGPPAAVETRTVVGQNVLDANIMRLDMLTNPRTVVAAGIMAAVAMAQLISDTWFAWFVWFLILSAILSATSIFVVEDRFQSRDLGKYFVLAATILFWINLGLIYIDEDKSTG
ncbi:MAG TPA: ankyrin repeat domain-containing protein, partial [Desulfomonilaceae bacterium]|nr:ankyrin repeat domain-containing protein [Desulfomonilaceae bacterium]